MIARLFRKSAPPPRALPALPAGERVYAIGDIHGHAELLDDLLRQIVADDAARLLSVCVGGEKSQLFFCGVFAQKTQKIS